MKYLCPIVLLFVIACGNVFAQSDTVSYRSLRSWLGDSTVIRYELGSICHCSPTTQEYLHFAIDSAKAKTLADWFRTKPFVVSGNDDTLTVYRHIRHEGAEPYSAPSTSAYNPMTTVLFILEVRNSKTDQLLQRLDTLASYLDRNGDLRYESFPPSNNTVKSFSLKQIAPRTEVYLTLTRAASLPVGVAVVREELSPQINAYPKFLEPAANPSFGFNIISTNTDFGEQDPIVKTTHSTPQKKTAKSKGSIHRKTFTTGGGGVAQEVYDPLNDEAPQINIVKNEETGNPPVTVTTDNVENTKTYAIKKYSKSGSNDEQEVHEQFVMDSAAIMKYERSIPTNYLFHTSSQPLFGFRFHSKKSGVATITVKPIDDTDALVAVSTIYTDQFGTVIAPPEYVKRPVTVDSLTLYQQINDGDNFMLLASHHLSNGTYLVRVMMDGKEIYHSKRGVH